MMDLKERLLAEMMQNDLARANGKIMRALNAPGAELQQSAQYPEGAGCR